MRECAIVFAGPLAGSSTCGPSRVILEAGRKGCHKWSWETSSQFVLEQLVSPIGLSDGQMKRRTRGELQHFVTDSWNNFRGTWHIAKGLGTFANWCFGAFAKVCQLICLNAHLPLKSVVSTSSCSTGDWYNSCCGNRDKLWLFRQGVNLPVTKLKCRLPFSIWDADRDFVGSWTDEIAVSSCGFCAPQIDRSLNETESF
jgi:hypothetical protein